MEDLGLIIISGQDLADNLERALAEPDPKPWAFVKRLRQMQGLTPGTWIAWIEFVDDEGRRVNRFARPGSVILARRAVLGQIVSGVDELAEPYFEGYPFEFRWSHEHDETFERPISTDQAAVWLNARIADLDLASDQLETLVGHAKSNKVGLFVDGAPRTARYFESAAPPSAPEASSASTASATGIDTDSEPGPDAALHDVVDDFVTAIHDAGLHFGDSNATLPWAFLASLVAKRFALLTGLSGSGKTLLARALGQWLGADPDGERRYLVAPVRPDWTSPYALLGYEDGLLDRASDGRAGWNVPEVLRFVLTAARRPQHLRLLVLDEMNLAHVERYFADFLSGIESGEPVVPNLQIEPDGCWRLPATGQRWVPFPTNLLVVGTVNVDETTYQFSPKVLDRAFSFEFRVTSRELDGARRRPSAVKSASDDRHQALLRAGKDENAHLDSPITTSAAIEQELVELHEELSKVGFEFGHRTYFEALRFAWLLHQVGITDSEAAMDWIVLAKVLPRLHGSRQQLEQLLQSILQNATGSGDGDPPWPLTAKKVTRMLDLVRANHFVSFAE